MATNKGLHEMSNQELVLENKRLMKVRAEAFTQMNTISQEMTNRFAKEKAVKLASKLTQGELRALLEVSQESAKSQKA
jgi:hypothetical protein